VSPEEEEAGLDVAEHGEGSYDWSLPGLLGVAPVVSEPAAAQPPAATAPVAD